MKSLFYINFAFGANIFLDVEDGIFKGCSGDTSIEKAIDRKYIGKSISFLKEDFEKSMKPSYSRVSPHELNINLRQFTEWQGEINRIAQRNQEMTPAELEGQKIRMERLAVLEDEINIIKQDLKDNHGYEIKN